MVTRGATKRKYLGSADDKEQEPAKPDSRKQLKGRLIATSKDRGNDKERRKRVMKDSRAEGKEDEDEYEYEEDVEAEDEDEDEYDDSHSQKRSPQAPSQNQFRHMMLFEKRLKEIKKQKKSTSESSSNRFKKKIKLQEEALITSLKEEKTKIKTNGSDFSKVLTALFNNALNSSLAGPLAEFTMSSPKPVQSHQLHAPHTSVAALSTKLLAYTQSLQATLTTVAGYGLVIGEGWEQDGDLSISILRQAQRTALAKLAEMTTKDGDGDATSMTEETEAVAWRCAVKRSTKGISNLLKNLPIPTTNEEREVSTSY